MRNALGLDPAADAVPAVARELGRKLDAAEQAESDSEAAAVAIAKLREERQQVSDAREAADTELGPLDCPLPEM